MGAPKRLLLAELQRGGTPAAGNGSSTWDAFPARGACLSLWVRSFYWSLSCRNTATTVIGVQTPGRKAAFTVNHLVRTHCLDKRSTAGVLTAAEERRKTEFLFPVFSCPRVSAPGSPASRGRGLQWLPCRAQPKMMAPSAFLVLGCRWRTSRPPWLLRPIHSLTIYICIYFFSFLLVLLS